MSTTLTVDFFSSVDGYGSAEGWPGYWGKEGPEIVEDRVRTFQQDQVLVFGATTFREFSQFVTMYDEPYYDRLDELPKIVFSSTRTRASRSRLSARTSVRASRLPSARPEVIAQAIPAVKTIVSATRRWPQLMVGSMRGPFTIWPR